MSRYGGASAGGGGGGDVYDFDISGDLSPESSGDYRKPAKGGRGTSSRGGGGGGPRASSSTAFSPPTDDSAEDDDTDDSSASFGAGAPSINLTNRSRGTAGGASVAGASLSKTGASLGGGAGVAGGGVGVSIEERVAARLARMESERQLRLANAVSASANVSAISGSSSLGRDVGGAVDADDGDSSSSLDNTAVTGITAASRARNLGATSSFTSAYGGGRASANTSAAGRAGGSGAGAGGRGGHPVLGSPLSPEGGDIDSSSSVDLSSGDFQIGAVAAKALAARRAAAQATIAARAAGNTTASTYTSAVRATVPEAAARSEESDSNADDDDEDDEDATGASSSLGLDDDEDDPHGRGRSSGSAHHSRSLGVVVATRPGASPPRAGGASAGGSPTRGVSSSSSFRSTSAGAGGLGGVAAAAPRDSSNMSFAEIAMLMREQALLVGAARAAGPGADAAAASSSTSSTLARPRGESGISADGTGSIEDGGRASAPLYDGEHGGIDGSEAASTAAGASGGRATAETHGSSIEIDAGAYRPAVMSFGDFFAQAPSGEGAAGASGAATPASAPIAVSARTSLTGSALPTVTVVPGRAGAPIPPTAGGGAASNPASASPAAAAAAVAAAFYAAGPDAAAAAAAAAAYSASASATSAALARSMRAAAAAALSKQLLAAAAQQRDGPFAGDDSTAPSVVLQHYLAEHAPRPDAALPDEADEAVPPPPPPRHPHPASRGRSVPLRADAIRDAVLEQGFHLRAGVPPPRSRSGSRSASGSRRSSRSGSYGGGGGDENGQERPRLPIPVRGTKAHAARSAYARDFLASHPSPARRRPDEGADDGEGEGEDAGILFRLVTREGDFALNGKGSPRRVGEETDNGQPEEEEDDREGEDEDDDGVVPPPPPPQTVSQQHHHRGTGGSRYAIPDVGSTHGKPIPIRSLQGEQERVRSSRSTSPAAEENAHKHLHHHGRPPLDASLANALIADAVAARYRAETRVAELQSAMVQMESKLQTAEASSASSSASAARVEEQVRPSPPSISLYALLREAVTNLTVHRHAGPDALRDDGKGATFTVKRFLREKDAADHKGRSGPRREWAPAGPAAASGGAATNFTANTTAGTLSTPEAPEASAAYFEEVPIAQAAAAAAGDGFRSYVPLELVAALQAELAAQEKMLSAYHADNQRLRDDFADVAEKLAASEAARAVASAEAATATATAAAALSSSMRAPPASAAAASGSGDAAAHELDRTGRGAGTDESTLAAAAAAAAAARGGLVGVGAVALEVERLRGELAHAREEARLRQEELGYELDRLRKAKKDLECRAAGVDMAAVSADAEEVVRLRAALAEARASHDREGTALRSKLDWYRDNQAIIDADAATIGHQAETIRDLQERLWALQAERVAAGRVPTPSAHKGGAPPPSSSSSSSSSSAAPLAAVGSPTKRTPEKGDAAAPGSPRSPGGEGGKLASAAAALAAARSSPGSDPERELALANRRIKELEQGLAVAEESLAKRHPDSLANLIREAKGSSTAVGEPAAVLAELEALRGRTAGMEEVHDRALRSLRQEHERMRAEYERREASLKDDVGALRVRLAALGETDPAFLLGDDAGGAGSGAGLGGEDDGPVTGAVAAISKRELALRARVKELETELERVRAFYQKKAKEERGSGGVASSAAAGVAGRAGGGSGRATPSSAAPSPAFGAPPHASGVPGGSDDDEASAPSKGAGPLATKATGAKGGANAGLKSSSLLPPKAGGGVPLAKGAVVPSAAAAGAAKGAGPDRRGSRVGGSAPGGSREPSPAPGSRRASVASGGGSSVGAASRVSASKPSLPPVPSLGGGKGGVRAGASTPVTTGSKPGATGKATAAKAGTAAAAAAAAAAASASSGTAQRRGSVVVGGRRASVTAGTHSSSSAAAGPTGAPIGDGPTADSARLAELLNQVARLEADNSALRKSSAPVPAPAPAPAPAPVPVSASDASAAAEALARPAQWVATARATQEDLCRQVEQLYAALALLEARAEARELELARAESAVAHAREAAAVLVRAQFEDALRAKDDMLRAARAEIQELMAALLSLQDEGAGAGAAAASAPQSLLVGGGMGVRSAFLAR
jgi:trimeric autotransporter adhesin